MSRVLMLVVFLAAAAFLVMDSRREREPSAAPPPPAVAAAAPTPVFSEAELRKMRASLEDPDPSVRWAAVQVLFNLRDPQLQASIERMLTQDPDPGVRRKLISLYRDNVELARLGGLVKGLNDYDKSVRLASLRALGEIGDPSVTTWVTALLKDVDPEVRIGALRTLQQFQDKRKVDFEALATKLRKDYDEAVKRAAARR